MKFPAPKTEKGVITKEGAIFAAVFSHLIYS
jgi:hypothetical protein